jgi:hypothetical protein
VDEEATRLVLETLFVLKAKVSGIHDVVVGEDEDDDGEAQEEEDT